MSDPHDLFFKETFSRKEIASDFLSEYLPRDILRQTDLNSLTIVKDSFVEKELAGQYSDILYTVSFNDSPLYIYLLFEHKSYADPKTGFQILKYMVRIWEQHFKQHPKAKRLPAVYPMVIFHGRHKWRLNRNFFALIEPEDEALRKYTPDFQFALHDIAHTPDAELKGRIFVRIVLLLMKYIFKPELKSELPAILTLMNQVVSQNTAMEMLEVFLRYVVKATGRFEQADVSDVLKIAFEGDDVMQTFIDKYIEQGKREGRREGRQEGQVDMLLRMFKARYGDVPSWVRGKVIKADADRLDEWSRRLFSAKRLEDIFQ